VFESKLSFCHFSVLSLWVRLKRKTKTQRKKASNQTQTQSPHANTQNTTTFAAKRGDNKDERL